MNVRIQGDDDAFLALRKLEDFLVTRMAETDVDNMQHVPPCTQQVVAG